MKSARLGRHGPNVSRIGMGCMFYGDIDAEEIDGAVTQALDLGISHLDTADVYDGGRSETAVGRAIHNHDKKPVVATKFGIRGRREDGTLTLETHPAYVKRACEASLERLGIETIDLYYLHRFDPEVPIEETVGAMAALVRDGKVRHLGLSEVSASTLRRAHAEHPIAALQCEYSLWTRGIEASVLPACRELGVALVAYSPLGRGFLAGAIRQRDQLSSTDLRRSLGDRFSSEGLRGNLAWLEELEAFSRTKNAPVSQIALAWLLAQGEDVFPIPGTRRADHVRSNAAAAQISLTEGDVRRLTETVNPERVRGARYPRAMEEQLRRESVS